MKEGILLVAQNPSVLSCQANWRVGEQIASSTFPNGVDHDYFLAGFPWGHGRYIISGAYALPLFD